MARKDKFAIKFPIIDCYINDSFVRENMLNNEYLVKKYNKYSDLIKQLIDELNLYLDNETTENIVKEVVLKMPNEILEVFIYAYLNSSVRSKANPDVMLYFNKIKSYGVDALIYIKYHGIITDRSYKDIDEIVLKEKLNMLAYTNPEYLTSEDLDKETIHKIIFTIKPEKSKNMIKINN